MNSLRKEFHAIEGKYSIVISKNEMRFLDNFFFGLICRLLSRRNRILRLIQIHLLSTTHWIRIEIINFFSVGNSNWEKLIFVWNEGPNERTTECHNQFSVTKIFSFSAWPFAIHQFAFIIYSLRVGMATNENASHCSSYFVFILYAKYHCANSNRSSSDDWGVDRSLFSRYFWSNKWNGYSYIF